jgi:glycosyltransferase involved in cell wall biosynthesis
MKILSFSTCPLDPMLGSGKTRLRWSTGLRELGHTVEVMVPEDYEIWFGMRRAFRFRQAWGAYKFVKEKLRSNNYDLIEFFGGEFGLITWQLSKQAQRPLIVAHTDGLELLASERQHAFNPPVTLKKKLYSWFSTQTHERLSRAAFVYADAFVTGCELDQRHVLDRQIYPLERTAVIAPGLDNEYLDRSFTPQKENRIAYTGSWINRKGTNHLTKVITHILLQDPNIHFDVYGTGGKRDAVLQDFPATLHNRVTVYEPLSNMELAEGLAKAKIFFFPTQYEGFGMALAEAMACSCAVVTTPTGFGAELRNREEAMICNFDDVEAMKKSIWQLLHNEELRIRIARNGWERVQTLHWDANIKKLEGNYIRWISEFEHTKQGAYASANSMKSDLHKR